MADILSEYDNPSTLRQWRRYLSELAEHNGWQHPDQMTAAGVVAFVTKPRADGRPTANNTARQRIAAVRLFQDHCRRHGLPTPNLEHVLRRLRKSHPRLLGKQQATYEARRLSRAELQQLFDACSDGTWRGSRDQITIRLLALGLRQQEVAQLTWGDVKNDGRIARLGKMNRLREVFPGPTLTEMIARWRAFYGAHIGPTTPDSPLLAAWPRAQPADTPNANLRAGLPAQGAIFDIVASRARNAGLGHVAPHDLRRSLAKIMHTEGCDLTQIQAALGHAETSGAVTQACYIGPLENSGRIAAGRMVD